jgi:hypothetical protein
VRIPNFGSVDNSFGGKKLIYIQYKFEPGKLRAGWSGVRIPLQAIYFHLLEIVQTVSGAHPDSYSMVTGFLYGGGGGGTAAGA